MNNKNLHKHSLPVILALAAVFVLSLSLMKPLQDQSGVKLTRALTTGYVHIERTRNGLARIGIDSESAAAQDAASMRELQAIGAESGKLTRLNFVVESLHPEDQLPK